MSTDLAIILLSALLAMAIVLARLGFDWLDRIAARRRRTSRGSGRRRRQQAPAPALMTSLALDEALDEPAPAISRPMVEPVPTISQAIDEPVPDLPLPSMQTPEPLSPPVPIVARVADQPPPALIVESRPVDEAAPVQPPQPQKSAGPTVIRTTGEPTSWRLPPAAALSGSSPTVASTGPSLASVGLAAAASGPVAAASDPDRSLDAEHPGPASDGPGPAPSPDVVRERGGLPRVLDESFGVYLFRRLFRRPTSTRARRQYEEASTFVATQRLHREFGIEPVQQAHPIQPTRIVVSGTAGGTAPVAASAAAAKARRAPSQRVQLARDGAIALAMFAVIAVVVAGFVTVWPGADGAVLQATGTPNGSHGAAGLSSASPTPTSSPSPSPTPTPTPTPTPAPTPTPTPAPTATPSPTLEPTRAPTATSNDPPAPDPTAASTATPKPTPKPTPTPVPPPPLVAFPSCSVEGFTVSCDGTASRSGAMYLWAFEQGPTLRGQSVSHTYAEPGTYTITLTVVVGDDQASESLSTTVPQ